MENRIVIPWTTIGKKTRYKRNHIVARFGSFRGTIWPKTQGVYCHIGALLLLVAIAVCAPSHATDTLFVRQPQVPILIERHDNALILMRIDAEKTTVLDNVTIAFSEQTDITEIASLKLYYSGTDARPDRNKNRFAAVEYISRNKPGKTLAADTTYSILKDKKERIERTVCLDAAQRLFPGTNFFWISIEMRDDARLASKIACELSAAEADGQPLSIKCVTNAAGPQPERRLGVGVRHAGDDGSEAYRIPGIVMTSEGTLLAVYDVRYNSSTDLQEYIDIGLSRSTDGGRTWEPMQLAIAMGEDGGLPLAQNGVGDPCILYDPNTHTAWIVAAWAHGYGNQRAWRSSQPGMDKDHTAQLVIAKSTDDGLTWSKPQSINEQVKKPEWYFLLQGPGMGITMHDGTLVVPIQYIDSERIPNAGVMFSKDGGETWTINNHARTNTTESQVAEIEPGVLMLNMRDNRGGSRAVYTTTDLGTTWKEHESSRTALKEPVCMASLIHVKAEDNALGRDLLLFSNPNTTKERKDITIKASLDGGNTWLSDNQLLLDEGVGWGYSCLTMVDNETIGILYESSVAHITFQTVKLRDLVRDVRE